MLKRKVILAVSILAFSALGAGAEDVLKYVDPFIGTAGSGNVFPGAALPFSMVKLGPDCILPSKWLSPNSGYRASCPIRGFSHTHVSGTGGGAKYGNFPVMPFVSGIADRDLSRVPSGETASPGYYSCRLEPDGIRCEMTLTRSVGFHRYTVRDGSPLGLYFNVSALLDKGSTTQHALDSDVRIESDKAICGRLRSEGGWNVGTPYEVWFYAETSRPFVSYGVVREDRYSPMRREEKSLNPYDWSRKAAWVEFDPGEPVVLKVAISFRSAEQAKENFRREAADLSFDGAREKASEEWRAVLSRASVAGPEESRKLFYTGLYRSLLMPVDRTGEMPGWGSDETYWDDYYAIWDTFRSSTPLLTIVAPEKVRDQINSLINIYRHEGWAPDARSGNCNGLVQGGTDYDIVIAEAAAKGVVGIDYAEALEMCLKCAETEPSEPRRVGRGGITQYRSMGYIPGDIERSCSRQMEYAACDAAIASLASSLGRDSVAAVYREQSKNWKNLWNPDAESEGIRGFIQPKAADGTWIPYDYLKDGSWSAPFYEGTSWQYSFYVPHDVPGLVEACGGKEEFVRRLDILIGRGRAGDRHFYNVGNEPSFLTPMLYTWAGRYDLSALAARRILDQFFHSGKDGLPGNDDSGAMGSWAAFQTIGLFPVAGTDLYLLVSPSVDDVRFNLPDGKSFEIRIKGASAENLYIRSAKLNGKTLKRAWIRHSEIVSGGILELAMGSKPGSFGTAELPE